MSSLSKQAAAIRTLLETGGYKLNDIAYMSGDPTLLDTLRQAAESLEWLDRNNVKIRPVLTEVRKLWGQSWTGPRGVWDQSKSRMREPASPPPVRNCCFARFSRS